MPVSKVEYMSRFYGAVDRIESGQFGAISESHYFVDNYRAEFYPILEGNLSSPVDRVRAETILLLSRLGVLKPAEKIREMSLRDRDIVVMACVAYEKAIEVSESMVPPLLAVLNRRNGREFAEAARKLGYIATAKDVPEIRRIYGQVQGEMRDQIRDVLVSVIERDPDLDAKRDFILSVPVYPDEKAFLAYADKAVEYLDVRYRKNVEPRRTVSVKLHNNVALAILQMQIRLYNERENMQYYSADAASADRRLRALISWAADDLNSKELETVAEERGRVRGIRER